MAVRFERIDSAGPHAGDWSVSCQETDRSFSGRL